MDDLVAFLRARLDEDEAAAAAAQQETTGCWTARETYWGGGAVVEDCGGALILPTAANDVHYPHVARHGPARVLAEVEAKRELLRVAEAAADFAPTFTTGVAAKLEDVLRRFAWAYREHPDYRPKWAPEGSST